MLSYFEMGQSVDNPPYSSQAVQGSGLTMGVVEESRRHKVHGRKVHKIELRGTANALWFPRLEA